MLLLLCATAPPCCRRRDDGSSDMWLRAIQLMMIVPLASNYFVFVWTPAMADSMPQLGDLVQKMSGPNAGKHLLSLPYVLAAFAFFGILRVEQLISRQSQEDGAMSISVSKDGELRGSEELVAMIGSAEADEKEK